MASRLSRGALGLSTESGGPARELAVQGCYRVQGRPAAAGVSSQQGNPQPPTMQGESDAHSLLTLRAPQDTRSHISHLPPSAGCKALLWGSPAWNRSR